ncbi:MAG: intradiol ring-cleavage dioxygenase [Gammaproteobacteria bacterium]
MNIHRRSILSMGAALLVSPLISKNVVAATVLTPRQTAGPFYPSELPIDDDADLTRVAGQPHQAEGEITDLSGRVLDARGNAIRDAHIEIWQCDANGRYLHPGDRGGLPRDPGFQGHGRAQVSTDGSFAFRTIRPVAYPGRTPHIHVAVFTPGNEPFVTQLYIAGDPQNQGDFLFNRIPDRQKPLVELDLQGSQLEGVQFNTSVDIILAGENGTPSA